MRVLITGAGSTLGTALAPLLAEADFTPRLFDVRPVETKYEFVVGDVRRMTDVQAAVQDVDLIVHTATLHCPQADALTPEEVYAQNLTGTFNVYEAAARCGVRGVVFGSSSAVYGESARPPREHTVVALNEGVPRLPTDIAGFTQAAGEDMSSYYQRRHGIATIALRCGMFSPETFFRCGIRLLYGGIVVDDVARAVLAALATLLDGEMRWEVFNVTSLVPFTERDGPGLRYDPMLLLDRYYPGAPHLLRKRGVTRLQPIEHFYPLDWTVEQLNFQPQYNFDRWLEELRTRPKEHAEKDPPWP